jgi:hypothetical protein
MLVSIAMLSLLSAGVLSADDLSECKKELQEKLLANNTQAEKITFEQKTQRNKSRTEILYEGTGSFVRHTGRKETVTWQCTVENGTVKDASYRVDGPSEISAEMVSACESAIRDRIRNENKGSEAISFVTANRSQLDARQRLLSGTARFTLDGKDKSFDYQCIFNDTGALTDKKYEMR